MLLPYKGQRKIKRIGRRPKCKGEKKKEKIKRKLVNKGS